MKRHAPATLRNAEPIAAVLSQELPERGTVLEIASGTGEHAVHMARALPGIVWQPSDGDPDALPSIAAWAMEADLPNLRDPVHLDMTSPAWVERARAACADGARGGACAPAAIVCINMVHIAPWEASEGLFEGAGALLPAGAPLILYGPFREAEAPLAPSNAEFDRSLKARNPAWGLRDTATLDRLANTHGFTRTSRHPMPANNLVLVWRRTDSR